MADEKLERAQETFETLCAMLDADDWNYQKDFDNLTIRCGARGEDLPIEIVVKIDADKQLVVLMSDLPVRISPDKRMEACVAICMVNDTLIDGDFDFDITDGQILFRLSNSFIDSDISQELFKYMVYVSCSTVDEFNDKFLLFNKGLLSVEDFMPKS